MALLTNNYRINCVDNDLSQYVCNLDRANKGIIQAFSKAVAAKDVYIRKHHEHVAKLLVALGEALKLSRKEIRTAYIAGLMHDIGKIGIPDQILNKPGRLTSDEYSIVKRHSETGAEILCEIDSFWEIADIVRYHHERYDGQGYPYGIKGNDIPFLSRMVAVCDSYDAMTSIRCYRLCFSREKALMEIKNNCNRQFDPDISWCFIELMQ